MIIHKFSPLVKLHYFFIVLWLTNMDNRIHLLMILVVGMLIMEIILIMISIKWLYNIWVNNEHIAESSKDFPSIFTKDIEEVKLLYQELKKLIHINGKKEDKILHGLFFSEEIKITYRNVTY